MTLPYFKLPGFKLLCLVAPNRMTRTSPWIAFGGFTCLFVLDFLRGVRGRDISIFICFNLSKPKSERNRLLSFY